MARVTTGVEAMFKVAEDVGLIHAAVINVVSSQTSLKCTGMSLGENRTFTYGYARVLGKGIRQITSYNEAQDLVGLASAFDSNVAAGEVVEVAFFEPIHYAMIIASVNDAVRTSYPYYYRETLTRDTLTGTVSCAASTAVTGTSTRFLDELIVGDALKIGTESRTISAIASQTALTVSSAFTETTTDGTGYHASGLTYDSQVHIYALPTTVHDLIAIGWALSSSDPVSWIPPLSDWRVTGTDGAYLLNLKPGTNWGVQLADPLVAYAGNFVMGGTLAHALHGKEIHLHYVSREPEYTSLTDVTNLPVNYFAIASENYAQRRMTMLNPETAEAAGLASTYELIKIKSNEARSWLLNTRPQIATLKGPQVELP